MARTLCFLAVVIVVSGCGETQAPPTADSSVTATTADLGIDDADLIAQSEPVLSAEEEAAVVGNAPTTEIPATPFRKLCDAYASGDGDAWNAAEKELFALGHEATPSLVAALNDGAAHERELAASMLAQIGSISTEARTALKQALTDESVFVQANAAATLCAIEDPSPELLTALERLFSQNDKDGRIMAISSAGNLGRGAAKLVPQLAKILRDENPEVRRAAVETLGKVGPDGKEAIESLQTMADSDPDEDLRESAKDAIAKISGEPAAEQTSVIPASASKPAKDE